jgi:hypothetical protein
LPTVRWPAQLPGLQGTAPIGDGPLRAFLALPTATRNYDGKPLTDAVDYGRLKFAVEF